MSDDMIILGSIFIGVVVGALVALAAFQFVPGPAWMGGFWALVGYAIGNLGFVWMVTR